MAVNQQQITPDSGVAQQYITLLPVPGQTITDGPVLLRQIRSGFMIEQVNVYCRTYTATLAASVGILPVGTTLQAVTLEIAATTDRFKLGNAILGLSGTHDANTGMATIVQKAITDNLEFSAAYTINVAAAAGQFWGAFRIQMDAAGTISTRAVSQDQNFRSNADAVRNAPAAAANMIDLGTISIGAATGAAFTCNTTALNAAGTTVNYNGASSGFVLATTTAQTFVAATVVQGTMASDTARRTPHPGALLVALYTSDGSMVVTDPEINIAYRPYPMNNEAFSA